MTFRHHITEFAGLPVELFPADADSATELVAPETAAWRLDCHDEEYCGIEFAELLATFLERVDGTQVRALITGLWMEWADADVNPVAEDLAAVADRLPGLRALFLGELVQEQSQPSWIYQKPVTPVLAAYPELEELWVRGTPEGMGLPQADSLPMIAPGTKHAALRKLVLQSGGLPGQTIRALAECDFPELTHLEIYLGHPNYGGDASLDDLAPLLDGTRFPKLRHLGLKDSMTQDEIAAAVAQAPVVAQLEALDLSLGTLGDEGAAALLAGQPLGHLRKLDLSHHYLSSEMQDRLRQAWPTVEIDLSNAQSEDRWGRYIAVAE